MYFIPLCLSERDHSHFDFSSLKHASLAWNKNRQNTATKKGQTSNKISSKLPACTCFKGTPEGKERKGTLFKCLVVLALEH